MRKKDEVADPNSCLNKAKDDDILFVLKDTDQAMVDTVLYWIKRRIELGLNQQGDAKMTEAAQLANAVRMKQSGVLK